MNSDPLRDILRQVQNRALDLDAAAEQVAALNARGRTADCGDVRVDLDRARRCGFPEVVYAEGKSSAAVCTVFARLAERQQDCLATRVTADQARAVMAAFPAAVYNEQARTVRLMCGEQPVFGRVLVVTAGTSDRPVAEEAVETLRWMRCGQELLVDVGVAGPHRLIEQLPRFHGADAVVVIAGMEGALPSIVGGWVDCPVIAVPTSIGYGAALGGFSALLAMLTSCAANIAVVNIDAGFKGAYLAGLIARRRAAPAGHNPPSADRSA